MSIKIGDDIIETDEEGYVLNPDDWTEKVAEEMAFQQSQQDNVKLTDEHWGSMQYFRDHANYKTFFYELFPRGPVPELCKLAGLPKPGE